MRRVGFVLKVKADQIAEYKARHEAVWPEMLEALRKHGWRNYSLFLREDGTLFGYVEVADSFEASRNGMETEAINATWQASVQKYFENIPGLRADQAMVELEEVFHLD